MTTDCCEPYRTHVLRHAVTGDFIDRTGGVSQELADAEVYPNAQTAEGHRARFPDRHRWEPLPVSVELTQ